MPEDPLKKIRELNKKYGITGVDTPTQAEKLDLPEIQTGILSGYAPQSEESKRFDSEWNQKGGGEKFRTGVKAGWENMKGGLKYAGSELWDFMAGSMGNIAHIDPGGVEQVREPIKKSAEKNFAAAPEGKGFAYETGQFIPQTVGTMAALATAPPTGGTSLAAIPMIIGTANTAALGGMVLGQTLHEYDQYTTDNGIEPNDLTRWGVALGAATAEFAAEKVRLGRLLPDGLAGKMMGQTLKMKPDLADDMMRKWAKGDPKMFDKFKKLAKTTLLNANEEGLEEFGTEFVQSYLNNVYLQGDDKNTFDQVIGNSLQAYKGGAMMGGMLGPASYTSNQMYHKMRRNRNGVTIVETTEGNVYEYLGADEKDPNMVLVMDNKLKTRAINKDYIKDHRYLDGKELKDYLNVYRDAQESLPQMEEQFRRNTARQHVDGIGRNLMYQGEEESGMLMGKTKDNNYVFIRSTRDEGPMGQHYITVDPETMTPSMVSVNDITETFPVDYDTWLEGEVDQMMGVQDQKRQEEMAGAVIEEEIKEAAGVNNITPGEKVSYQGREWVVSEVGSDGSLSVDEIAEGDDIGENIVISAEEIPNVLTQAPEAPVQEAEGQGEQAAQPETKVINDGKNDYNVIDGKIDQVYTTSKQANGIAKKLSEEYPKLAFNVHEFDKGDPFQKNDFTITVEVPRVAAKEEAAPETMENATKEESAEMAPETTEESPALLDPKKREEYGLEPLRPTFRGTTMSEWENMQNGEVISSDNMQGATWVSDKKEYSDEYVKSKEDGVLIEFKPEAIDKSVVESGQANDDTGVRLGKGLTLDDVARVTDKDGNVLYEASAKGETQNVEEVNTDVTEAPVEVNEQVDQSQEDALAETEEFQPEPVAVEEEDGKNKVLSELEEQLRDDYEDYRISEPDDDFEYFLEREKGIEVTDDGSIDVNVAIDDSLDKLLKGKKVNVYHATSDTQLKNIKEKGLIERSDVDVNRQNKPSLGVYVSTISSGPAMEGYGKNARQAFGGDPIMLKATVLYNDLQRDTDDEDIQSADYQFVINHIAPENIEFTEQQADRTTQDETDQEPVEAGIPKGVQDAADVINAIGPSLSDATEQQRQDYRDAKKVIADSDYVMSLGKLKEREQAEPVQSETEQKVEAAEAATDPNPSEAEIKAGNAKKGHVSIQGMQIAIENAKSSTRSGTDQNGKEWSITMNNTYGYFNRTLGKDGDQIDVFLGDNLESNKVFVVDQVDPVSRKFDEHKTMVGFDSAEEAEKAYLSNYEDGWQGMGAITEMDMPSFKKWVGDGKRKRKPVSEMKTLQTKEKPVAKPTEGVREDVQRTEPEPTEVDTESTRALQAEIDALKQSLTDTRKARQAKKNELDKRLNTQQSLFAGEVLSDKLFDVKKDGSQDNVQNILGEFDNTIAGIEEDIGLKEKQLATAKKEEAGQMEIEAESESVKSELFNQVVGIIDGGRNVLSDVSDLIYKSGDINALEQLLDIPYIKTNAELPNEINKRIGYLQRHTEKQAKPVKTKQEEPTYAAKLEDFGEKIGGAQKDKWTQRLTLLNGLSKDDLFNKPLSETIPIPDYQELVSSGKLTKKEAGLLHYYRTNMPRKPASNASNYKRNKWLEQAELYRDVYTWMLNKEEFAKEHEGKSFMDLMNEQMGVKAVKEIDKFSDLIISLGFPETFNGNMKSYEIKQFSSREDFTILKGRYIIEDFATYDEAISALKHILEETNGQRSSVRFDIWSERGVEGYLVGKKVAARKYITLAGPFKTVKEASTHIKESQTELEEQLSKEKEVPDERPNVSEERTGKDYREGKDVTPEMFTESFGFRGVEFGNWVENDKRQKDLNRAYDALMDLADVVGIPTRAISLGGELGLAFGARGKGGKKSASAHYEPGKVVINLTKVWGAGSLAHEWWHAVDNYFSRTRGEGQSFLTEKPRVKKISGREQPSNKHIIRDDTSIRPEVIDAFHDVSKAIRESGMVERSKGLDLRRTKDYWSQMREMSARSFESYIKDQLSILGIKNDYLVSFKDMVDYIVDAGFSNDENLYPYPTKEEQSSINRAFQNVWDVIETKEDGKNILLFEDGAEYRNLYESEINAAYGSQEKHHQAVDAAAKLVRESSLIGIDHRGRNAIREREEAEEVYGGKDYDINKVSPRTVLESFQESGYIDFTGIKVESPQDVADLFAIHRSPYIEKGHIVFLKDNVIIGSAATTLNRIDSTVMPGVDIVLKAYKRLGADGMYMLHNHPSGRNTPSVGDVFSTLHFQEKLSEIGGKLIGHVIIDHNKFSFIDVNKNPFYGNNRDTYALEQYINNSVQEIDYKNAVPKLFTEREHLPGGGAGPWRMVEIGKALLNSKGYKGAIIYLGQDLSISAYDVFPEGASTEDVVQIANDGLKNNLGSRLVFVHDGSFDYDWHMLFPSATLDVINTEKNIRQEFRTENEKPVSQDDAKALWDKKSQYGEDTRFKKQKPTFAGEALSGNIGTDVRSIAQKLAKELNTPIVVVENRDELPQPIQRAIKDNDRIPGAYDVRNDKVYLIASEVKDSDEAVRIVLHEVVGHKGLRELLGSEFDQMLMDVYNGMSSSQVNIIKNLYNTTDKLEIADEHIALMAEYHPNQTILDKIAAWVRRQLRKLFKVDYSNNDIIDLLRRSRKNLKQKTKPQFAGEYLEPRKKVVDDSTQRMKDLLAESNTASPARKQEIEAELMELYFGEGELSSMEDQVTEHKKQRERNNALEATMNAPRVVERDGVTTMEYTKADTRKKVTDDKTPDGPPEDVIRTKGERARRTIQDKNIAIRKIQDLVKKEGGYVNEYSNAYRQENLSHGIVKSSIESYDKKFIDPLLKQISDIQKKTGMSYKEINEYMMAKHAPERNKELQKKSRKDVNSGMTTEKADELVKQYESTMTDKQIAGFWKGITKATRFALQRSKADGFISKETYDKLSGPDGYKYYVPLRGWAQTESDALFEYMQHDVGKSVNPFKSAKGRSSIADDPLQYIVNMAHTAIVMGEKNKIKQHMAALIRNNKDNKDLKKVFSFKKVYYVWDGTTDKEGKKVYNEVIERPAQELFDKGMVETKFDLRHMSRRPMSHSREHEADVWIAGQKYTMILPADVANALNKTPSKWDENSFALQQTIGKVTRFLSSNFTSKNPAFIPVNQIRDMQYALLSHMVKGEKGDAKAFLKAVPGARSAIIRDLKEQADMTNRYDKMYRDFKLNGGETGYIHLRDVDQLARELKKDLKRLNDKNVSRKFVRDTFLKGGEMLEHWAIRSENLSRFATYVVAIEAGKSPKQAAQEAKDITVNFNRKGRMSSLLGTLYAFFNAGLQGGHNIAKLGKDHTGKFLGVGAGFMAMGFLTALFNSLWAGDDDDDTMNDYEELSDYQKYNNLVIPVPGSERFVLIPLPHGFRWFNSMGVLGYQALVSKEKDIGKAVRDGMENMAAAVSPVNPIEFVKEEGGLTARPIIPTALMPINDLMVNEDFAGNRIKREPFTSALDGRLAASQMGQKHVNKGIKAVTDQIFKAGGGDPEVGSKFYLDQDGQMRKVNGFMDINPSSVEHVIEYYLGGRGKFWNNVLKTSEGIVTGAHETIKGDKEFQDILSDVNVNNVPILRRMYSQPWQNSVYTRYYDVINELDDYKSLAQRKAGLNDDVDVSDLMDPYHEFVSDELKSLRKDLKYINEDIKEAKGEKEVQALKDQQELYIRNFIEMVSKQRENMK